MQWIPSEKKEQSAQEPEWWHGIDAYGCNRFYHKTEVRPAEFDTPLYTTPPRREWVGLTDEEKSDLWCKSTGRDCVNEDTHVFADVLEAKLKEKNGG